MLQDKALLRKRFLQVRSGIARSAHEKWDEALTEHLTEHLRMLAARSATTPVLAAYRSFGGEPDVQAGLDTLAGEGWRIAYPKTDKKAMALHFYEAHSPLREADFKRGPFGIWEPDPERTHEVLAADIDMVLIPGVAFSRAGVRLGYGGGYYDRWLAAAGTAHVRIGISYQSLVQDELPRADHDVLVHHIVTEKGVIVCPPQR